MRAVDFIGTTQGKLFVIEVVKCVPNAKLKCRCECGEIILVQLPNFKSGQKSCKKCANTKQQYNVGDTIHDWIVLDVVKQQGTAYKLQCKCKKIVTIREAVLLQNKRKSCAKCSAKKSRIKVNYTKRNNAIIKKRYIGVSFHGRRFRVDCLGKTFDTAQEAAKAYDEQQIKLHGDNAVLNFELEIE